MHKNTIIVITAIIAGLALSNQSIARTITYTDDSNTEYVQTYNSGYYPYQSPYCAPQEGVLTKIKNAFFGTPTGYTPSIQPSSYLNSYGPSYMRGFYGNTGWNSHNSYSPMVTGSGIHILD